MKRIVYCIIILFLIINLNFSATAIVETAGDVLIIEYESDTIKLKPDEEGVITFTITNIDDRPIYVRFQFYFVEAPGSPRGAFNDSYVHLQPNETKSVDLFVESHADYNQDPDASRFTVQILWGEMLNIDEGSHEIEFQIEDDFSVQSTLFVFVIVIIIAIIIIIIILIRKRRKNRA
jgi:hypothetical protein